jgi:predicted metal-dependent hydrolase
VKLDYTVIYSTQRKKLTITVERDRSVVVHAPAGTAPERIEATVNAKRQWIFQKIHHPQKYTDLPHPPGKELVNGESVLYLGRHYRIELVDEGDEIEFAQKFIIPKTLAGQKRTAFQAWYKARATEKILERVPGHARSLGVSYNQAKIMDSQYQWGSCTPKDNLNFNWRLIKAPMFVIDYVIIHELAHLLEPNHTPRFWNIIRAQIADVDKAKVWLKDNGALLEMDI